MARSGMLLTRLAGTALRSGLLARTGTSHLARRWATTTSVGVKRWYGRVAIATGAAVGATFCTFAATANASAAKKSVVKVVLTGGPWCVGLYTRARSSSQNRVHR